MAKWKKRKLEFWVKIAVRARFYGVVVSTLNFESSDLGLTLVGREFCYYLLTYYSFYIVIIDEINPDFYIILSHSQKLVLLNL